MKSRNKGITLISLVITIVIMLILTGITINLLFGDNGLITKTKLAKKAFLGEDAKQVVEDRINAYIAEKGPEGELDLYDFWYMYNGDSNLDTYDENFVIYLFEDVAVNFPSLQTSYTKGTKYDSAVVIYKGYQMTVNKNFTVAKEVKAIADLTEEYKNGLVNEKIPGASTWDETKGIQTPALSEGMIPVKYDTSTSKWIVCSASNTNNEWYEYKDTTSIENSSNWANVMLMDGITVKVPNLTGEKSVTISGYNNGTTYTSGNTISNEAIKKATREELNALAGSTVEKEGSMFVWIPRYEYKITGTTIDVNFISTKVKSGIDEYTTAEGTEDDRGLITLTSGPEVSKGTVYKNKEVEGYYIIHPAFTANINNGGWDNELPGIWVAKYEAGFQENVDNGGEIKETNKKYTNNDYYRNAIQYITLGTTNMSYPVFKKKKYSYNCINIGDIYTLCQEIKGASFYGLSSSTTDSHLMKNSEWGAVAYLAHSKYGRNGTEVTKNSYNEGNSSNMFKYGKTGYEGETSSSAKMSTGSASTTGNMTGIFDLSGGCWEFVATFNSEDDNGYEDTYGKTFATKLDTNISTKYATCYNNTSLSNEIANSKDNKTGDATYETAGWNSDYSSCAYSSYPFFMRGGDYNSGSDAGVFASRHYHGTQSLNCSFRPVLVAQ